MPRLGAAPATLKGGRARTHNLCHCRPGFAPDAGSRLLKGSSVSEQPRYKVYVTAMGDVLRTPAGVVRIFTDLKEAQAVAAEEYGFVQPANSPSPGGHDRTFA